MVSDGRDPAGATFPAVSASGTDVFFETREQLAGQDTDTLGDIYDARIDGGFPALAKEASCSGESCQGSAPAAPALAGNATSVFTGGGNLTPGSTAFSVPTTPKPKPSTKAHELAKALKHCRRARVDLALATGATTYEAAADRSVPFGSASRRDRRTDGTITETYVGPWSA